MVEYKATENLPGSWLYPTVLDRTLGKIRMGGGRDARSQMPSWPCVLMFHTQVTSEKLSWLAVGSMTSSQSIIHHSGIAYAPSPLITDFNLYFAGVLSLI